MIRMILALGMAAGLTVPATAAWASANPFNDKLMQLSPVQRNAVLRQAVTKDGQRCGRLSAGAFRGTYKNLAFWTARCTPGGDYGIFVGPGGEAQVRPCTTMQSLGLPLCGKME